jgi:hypothetical protein
LNDVFFSHLWLNDFLFKLVWFRKRIQIIDKTVHVLLGFHLNLHRSLFDNMRVDDLTSF